MIKLQNAYNNYKITLTALFFVILSSFVLLSPKLSSDIFAVKREYLLQNFINNTIKNQKINPQEYWKLREFYSSGNFIFERDGLSKNAINNNLSKIGVTIYSSKLQTFLSYSSQHLTSIDSLTNANKLEKIVTNNNVNNIYKNTNEQIYRHKNKVIIIFLKTSAEMKKANGFFSIDYEDDSLINNKYWVNITSITE